MSPTPTSPTGYWQVRAYLTNGSTEYPFVDSGPAFDTVVEANKHAERIAHFNEVRTETCVMEVDGRLTPVFAFKKDA